MVTKWWSYDKILFVLALLAIVFILGYNINKTNSYINSLFTYNHYQGTKISKYLTEQIDINLDRAIEEKLNNNELSAILSFDKTARFFEIMIGVFSLFATIVFGLFGLFAFDFWRVARRDKEKLEGIVRSAKQDAKKIKKQREIIEALGYNNRLNRLKDQSEK